MKVSGQSRSTDFPSAVVESPRYQIVLKRKRDAENILKVLEEQKTAQVIKIDPADKQEKAPQLYSLTALQRDANRFLGFTAQQTLDYTQSLYEKKLVTYPRTDSRFSYRRYGKHDSLIWQVKWH